MSTFFLDVVGGNDSNDGTTFANRWKTLSSGATAARIAPGDTIRVMASTDPTSLGQTATWTAASKTVTLTSAVTADIDTGEAAWTASANVTCTTDATQYKEGTKSASHAIATGFATGLAAYKAISSTDYSAYKQISLWIRANATFTAGQLQVKLCSDNAGVTAVDTFDLPAYPVANVWMPVTVDKGSALGSAIQSVALYVVTDFGAVTLLTDNIIACKDSTSADALSLRSFIGKIWNLNWAASTAYASNDIRKPTTPNRNGFRYKVTAGGGGNSGSSEPTWPTDIGLTVTDGALTWTCDSLEEPWFGIQSIRGTTVLLDTAVGSLATAGRGYQGTTESVTTYKREPLLLTNVSGTTSILGAIQDSGSVAGGQIVFDGGWDRTNMSSQTGETLLSGQTGTGVMFDFNGKNFVTLKNIDAVNCNVAFYTSASCSGSRLVNVQATNCTNALIQANSGSVNMQVDVAGFITANCNSSSGAIMAVNDTTSIMNLTGRCVGAHNSGGNGIGFNIGTATLGRFNLSYVEAKNNALYGINHGSGNRPAMVRNLVTSNNASGGVSGGNADVTVIDATISEATQTSTVTAGMNARINLHALNGATTHKVVTDGGTIASATDQRHTASGISWKFNPTATTRHEDYPLTLSVAKIAAVANVALTLGIWVRRDNANIKGRIKVKGGQIGGIGADAYTDCQPSTNTWTQYTLAVTPTEDGVFEVTFDCFDGVGTANSLWIDDFSKA